MESEDLHAAVAVAVPVRRTFTYRAGPGLQDRLRPGVRVRVPFGPRKLIGTVVEWPVAAPEEGVAIKTIEAVVDEQRELPPAVLDLTRFVADYYLCSWGEAIEAALPPEPGAPRRETWLRLGPGVDSASLPPRAIAKRRILEQLAGDGWHPAASLAPQDRRKLPKLVQEGLIERVERSIDEAPTSATAAEPPPDPHVLTPGQREVLAALGPALDRQAFEPFLLFGATGSGKTEVYFQAVKRTLATGRSVIYLVPEIGLTPLLLSKIAERFPGQAAVLHSALGRRERHEAWAAVRDGRRRLVVGTRSAIFAPLDDPGLIVIDEEQDGSYKQADRPRYNARDLAMVRGRTAGAVVLLGSATPSMESFQHARQGRYQMLRLGGRVEQRPLPEVVVVDMREHYRTHGEVNPVSDRLRDELAACLGRGEQALVLRNRRGWAVALHCPTCGQRVCCVRCSLSLTWHRRERRLRCHTCGFETSHPEQCPTCNAEELKLLGEGSEQVEDRLREAFPDAVIERMDRDTIRRRGAHEALLRRFDSGEIDVLVGTQMIAKGHDFHRVTLVGVISADQALGLPDFRAAERTFQLLTQVAGRAGRGALHGRVVIQAFDPEHPLLAQAAHQDFEAFFDREIGYRRALRFPPLTALVELLVLDKDELQARIWSEALVEALRAAGGDRLLLAGPGPAPIERIKGLFRYQILARSAGRRRLVETVARALDAVEGQVPHRAVHVDVDPLSIL